MIHTYKFTSFAQTHTHMYIYIYIHMYVNMALQPTKKKTATSSPPHILPAPSTSCHWLPGPLPPAKSTCSGPSTSYEFLSNMQCSLYLHSPQKNAHEKKEKDHESYEVQKLPLHLLKSFLGQKVLDKKCKFNFPPPKKKKKWVGWILLRGSILSAIQPVSVLAESTDHLTNAAMLLLVFLVAFSRFRMIERSPRITASLTQ